MTCEYVFIVNAIVECGLVAILTGAGIADRNVRYSTLIARREARRDAEPEAPPPNLIHDAIHALDPRRQRFVSLAVRLAIEESTDREEQPEAMPEGDAEASFVEWVKGVADLTDEQVTAELEELYASHPEERDLEHPDGAVGALRDAIDAADGPAGDGSPSLPVTLIEPGTPEGTRSRLAVNVTPGAPSPSPTPSEPPPSPSASESESPG